MIQASKNAGKCLQCSYSTTILASFVANAIKWAYGKQVDELLVTNRVRGASIYPDLTSLRSLTKTL